METGVGNVLADAAPGGRHETKPPGHQGSGKRLLDFAAAAERENQQLRRENELLAFEVKRLHDELLRQREREEAERKILKLELENHLLRQARGLPPAKSETPPTPDANAPKQDEADSNKS